MKPPSRQSHAMTAKRRIESVLPAFVLRHGKRLRSCFSGWFHSGSRPLRQTLKNGGEGHSKHIHQGFVNRPARINLATLTRTDRSRFGRLKLLGNWHRLTANNYNNVFACRLSGFSNRSDRPFSKACRKCCENQDQGVAV